MKSTSTVLRTHPIVIGQPPLFITLCVVMWIAALVLIFSHPVAGVDAVSLVAAL